MKITRRTSRGGHVYDVYSDRGECLSKGLRGITTLIGVLDKPGLVPWAARLTAAAFKEKMLGGASPSELISLDGYKLCTAHRDSRADRGSDIHAIAERMANAIPEPEEAVSLLPEGEEEGWLVACLYRWIRSNAVTFRNVESYVACVHCGYAATIDFDLMIGGQRWILDVKTNNGVYETMHLQTAAQAHAVANTTDDPIHRAGDSINTGILWLNEKAKDGCELVPTRNDRETLNAVQSCIQIYNWKRGFSKRT